MKSQEELIIENKELVEKVALQEKLIKDMRDVLRFCARRNAGTHYQQESAKSMLLHNKKMVWDRWNEDGTYGESYRKWIFERGGQEALDANDAEEKELLGNS